MKIRRNGIRLTCAFYAFVLSSQAVSVPGPQVADLPQVYDDCHRHLHGLVAYLNEVAEVEGQSFSAHWQQDGCVVIRYTEFLQFMGC